MENFLLLIFKFFSEIGGYNPSVSSSFALYPFPYPDKTLTFDWDNIGTDISFAIKKYQALKNN